MHRHIKNLICAIKILLVGGQGVDLYHTLFE